MATLSSAMGARGGVLFAFTLAFLLTCLGLFGLSLTQFGEPQICKLHDYTTEALYSNNQYYRKWMAGMSNLNFPCSGTETLPGWPILGEAGTVGGPLTEQCAPSSACYNYNGPCNSPPAACSSLRDCQPTDQGGGNGFAPRFNWCMGNLSRLATCVSHVDCSDDQPDMHWVATAFNFFASNDGSKLCTLIDPIKFIEQCEARVAFADQRAAYGYVLPATFGVCSVLWIFVVYKMLCTWRPAYNKGSALPTRPTSTMQSSAVGAASSVSAQSQSRSTESLDKAETAAAALGGDMGDQADLAFSAAKGLTRGIKTSFTKSKTGTLMARITASPWWSMAKFMRAEVTELVTQFLAFYNPPPNTRFILWPLLHGALIIISAFVTPILFLRGGEDNVKTFNASLSIGYLVIGLPGLFGLFNEVETIDKKVSFVAITAWEVLLKVISVVMPLIALAYILFKKWEKNLRARGPAHDGGGSGGKGADGPVDSPSKRLKLVQRLYVVASWGVGALALLAEIGVLDCGRFRTCQVPPCSISPDNLPFGIPVGALPLETNSLYSNTQAKWRLKTGGGNSASNVGNGNWEQRANLKYGVKLEEASDGTYLFTLNLEKMTGSAINRQVTVEGAGSGGTVKNRVTGDAYGACTASFHVQCQEKVPQHAFRNTLLPFEFVQWRDPETDPIWKFVLADPKPACWTAAADGWDDAASGWWYDLMVAGPWTLAGAESDGTGIPGYVMDGTCTPATTATAQPGDACLNLARDVVYTPGYGYRPVHWSGWEFQGGGSPSMESISTSWSATNGLADDAGNPELKFELVLGANEVAMALAGGNGNSGGNTNSGGNNNNNNNNDGNNNNNGPSVTFQIQASGDVSSYTVAILDAMKTEIANAAGPSVQASDVIINVTPGSVLLDVSINVVDQAAADTAAANLSPSLASSAGAEALFANVPGITIQVEAIVSNVTAVTPSNNNNNNNNPDPNTNNPNPDPNNNNPNPNDNSNNVPADPNTPMCLGGSDCNAVNIAQSGQSVCLQTTESTTSQACTWDVPGGEMPSGPHCGGPPQNNCQQANDETACSGLAGCQWHVPQSGPHCSGPPDPCQTANDQTACNGLSGCNWIST